MSDGPSWLRSLSLLQGLSPGASAPSQKQKHRLRDKSRTESHVLTVAESHMQKAKFLHCSFLLLFIYLCVLGMCSLSSFVT